MPKIYKTISPPAQKLIDEGGPPSPMLKPGEIPPVAISWDRAAFFKTGAWRNVTPHYVKRLPPCRAGCPVGNDIEGWLEAVGNGRWDEALELLAAEQPLPAVCGRVCYHSCQSACNRVEYDGEVNIRAVERYLGDQLLKTGVTDRNVCPTDGGKILVVGSGPAGLSAGWMLRKLGHKVEIVERAPEPGGLLRYGIPAYRLPRKILDKEIEALSTLGIDFKYNVSYEPDVLLNKIKPEYDALFIAPGAAGRRSSGIEGDTDSVVLSSMDFLASVASGNPLKIGRKAAIIGGGNSAIDAARTAKRLGAKVTILYRRTRSEMPAYHEEIEAALEEGIKIRYLTSPEFLHKQRGKLKLRCIRNVLGKADDSGRRRPEPVPGSEFDVAVDNVIDAVGETPDFLQITSDKDEAALLRAVDGWGRTGIEGVFTGGDFVSWDRTVAHAIGSGKRAAMAIDTYLNNDGKSLEVFSYGMNRSPSAQAYLNPSSNGTYDNLNPVNFEDVNLHYLPAIKAIGLREIAVDKRDGNFKEILKSSPKAAILREASRCFHCGSCDDCGNCHVLCPDGTVLRDAKDNHLYFDYDHCKGCGVCVEECPRAVIEMKS